MWLFVLNLDFAGDSPTDSHRIILLPLCRLILRITAVDDLSRWILDKEADRCYFDCENVLVFQPRALALRIVLDYNYDALAIVSIWAEPERSIGFSVSDLFDTKAPRRHRNHCLWSTSGRLLHSASLYH